LNEASPEDEYHEGLILAALGPYTSRGMTLSLGVVIWKRNTIANHHITALLALTVLAFVGFFAFLILGIAYWRGSTELFQHLLAIIAAVTIGGSSAIGFWLILKSFGLTRQE
jgi:hypothetical protein